MKIMKVFSIEIGEPKEYNPPRYRLLSLMAEDINDALNRALMKCTGAERVKKVLDHNGFCIWHYLAGANQDQYG